MSTANKQEIERIWNENREYIDWENGDWLEYPYCREIYSTIKDGDYELDVYAQKVCGEYIEDITLETVRYKGERVDFELFSHLR